MRAVRDTGRGGLAALALGLGIIAVGCASPGAHATTDDDELIGGSTAEVAKYPATIGIAAAGRHNCTAAHVAPRLLLTAAHCVLNLGTMTAHYDADHAVDLRRADGRITTFPVVATHVHPAWLDACGKTLCSVSAVSAKVDAPDVAVIELAAPVDDLPIAAISPAPLAAGDAVELTGFGCTTGVHVTDTNVATALRAGPGKVVGTDVAVHEGSYVTAADAPVYGGNYALTAGQAGLCPGDSGGPLYRDGAVVGVNANYTLLPDAADAAGVPVTNWHTRLDASSRHDVGGWLATLPGAR